MHVNLYITRITLTISPCNSLNFLSFQGDTNSMKEILAYKKNMYATSGVVYTYFRISVYFPYFVISMLFVVDASVFVSLPTTVIPLQGLSARHHLALCLLRVQGRKVSIHLYISFQNQNLLSPSLLVFIQYYILWRPCY